jgi:hypothetical protein
MNMNIKYIVFIQNNTKDRKLFWFIYYFQLFVDSFLRWTGIPKYLFQHYYQFFLTHPLGYQTIKILLWVRSPPKHTLTLNYRLFGSGETYYSGRNVFQMLSTHRYQFFEMCGETPEIFLRLLNTLNITSQRPKTLSFRNPVLLTLLSGYYGIINIIWYKCIDSERWDPGPTSMFLFETKKICKMVFSPKVVCYDVLMEQNTYGGRDYWWYISQNIPTLSRVAGTILFRTQTISCNTHINYCGQYWCHPLLRN